MDELSELRERIAILEQKLAATEIASSVKDMDGDANANANKDNGSPVAAVGSVRLSAYDVVWYPKPGDTTGWYVFYPGNCFEYKGMSTQQVTPQPDEDGFVKLSSTASSTSVYLHAVIGLDDNDEEETSVKSLTLDTIQTKIPGLHERVLDIKIAGVKDFSVSQIVKGKLVYGGGGAGVAALVPAPFDIVESEGKVSNNIFYWDGVQKTIADWTIPSGTTAVYLVANQSAPSSSGEQPWTFSLSNAEGQAQEEGRVRNFKLYDLDGSTVTRDYRTTFLELNSPHEVSKFTVKKPNDNSVSAVLSACTASLSRLELSSGDLSARLTCSDSGNNIDIDTADCTAGTDIKIRSITYPDGNGGTTMANIVSSGNITIPSSQGLTGEVVSDVSLEYSNFQLTYTKTYRNLANGTTRTVGPTTIFTAIAHSENS